MIRTLVSMGNSTGVGIPAEFLAELNIKKGSKVNVITENGEIRIKPIKAKPKYNINELMANTDFEAQRQDPDLKEWNNMSPVGREDV
ncbi:AbrB/MazE/SpoVT family DNA-binding domain-containing protein [Vibrio sp. JC009]|uniref:AbrB/MazE/SpoVT family DNA-binding domain-containing protein n=1 Tax=Vibrio sp. JC009 TaxID=2912314 RepID=UPI0023B1C79F|nr:AbrB/MazE/SpoVT family DNA-binding domain-containing protein [Vibrio sp. JC009]WED20600.1 AbrB/MazE/SpoVT family DNA-binding domain-containing protein [Vibrio sp. JC009]